MVTDDPRDWSVRFELAAPQFGLVVDVWLRATKGRWVSIATFAGGRQDIGMAAIPQRALAASIASAGNDAIAALLADPRLFGVSAAVLRSA